MNALRSLNKYNKVNNTTYIYLKTSENTNIISSKQIYLKAIDLNGTKINIFGLTSP